MSPLLGHRPSLWMEYGDCAMTTRAQCGLAGANDCRCTRDQRLNACAPRYVSFVSHKLNQRDPVGTCFVTKTSDVSKVEEISPCRTTSHGQRKTGVCQAGFSAAVSKVIKSTSDK
ncbi:hypothetical protein evm_009972 [Chilo suppressalis]|nr:hypothetical protein evm_009972 [Chilo suppressalis]